MPSDYLFQQSEVVNKKLPEFFSRFTCVTNLIKKGSVEKIGERDFRAPFLTQNGGRGGTYDANGGAIGRGSASKGGVFIQTYYPTRMSFELTQLAIEATKESEIAQFSAFKKAMKEAVPEMVNFTERLFHTDGNPVLGTATAHNVVSSKSVYTMDTISGVQLFRRGQYVIVYLNDLSAARDTGAVRMIEQVDYEGGRIFLNAEVTSAGATDKLLIEGVSGATPAGPKGLYYFNSYATSGTTLGVNRATELEVVANSVNAGGVPTHMKGLQIKHKMLKRRGELPKGIVGLCSTEQQANIYQNVQNIANFDLSKGPANKDLLPDMDMDFKYAGMSMKLDIMQRADRLDFIVPTDWIRARLKDVGFWEMNGNRFFTLYGSDGSPASAMWFALTMMEDYVCMNPGNGGVIYGCTAPTY